MNQLPDKRKETGRLLKELGLSLSLAESCTGGMIGAGVTDVPGCSAYFAGGVVAYENRIKEKVLGVPAEKLEAYGAVSEEVALAMAEGVKKLFKTDIAIAVSGLAGPGGGTAEKPVGLVYLAMNGPDKIKCLKFRLKGTRGEIRKKVVDIAFEMLYEYLFERKNNNI